MYLQRLRLSSLIASAVQVDTPEDLTQASAAKMANPRVVSSYIDNSRFGLTCTRI